MSPPAAPDFRPPFGLFPRPGHEKAERNRIPFDRLPERRDSIRPELPEFLERKRPDHAGCRRTAVSRQGGIDDTGKLEETGVQAVRKFRIPSAGSGRRSTNSRCLDVKPEKRHGTHPATASRTPGGRSRKLPARSFGFFATPPPPEYSDSPLKERGTSGERSGRPASPLRIYRHYRDNWKNGRSDRGDPLRPPPREKVPETPFTPNRNPYTVFRTGPTAP